MLGAATWMPTTAEITEIAGVSTPSPMIMDVARSTTASRSIRAPLELRKSAAICEVSHPG